MAAPIPSYQLPGGGKASQLPLFNPEQMNSLSSLLQFGQNKLANPQAGFEPIANLARTKLNTEVIPSIAERFTAMGNNRTSSTFQNQLGAAATDLEAQLAALASQYGLQNEQSGLNFINAGLRPTYENAIEPKQPGFFESLLAPLGLGAGAYGAYKLFGGGAGAGGATNLLGGATGGGSILSGLSTAATSAAPYALPLAAGAGALALPFLAYKLFNK